MNTLRKLILAAALMLAALVPNIESRAASWNDAYGVGPFANGIPFSVITSVHSNAVYIPFGNRTGLPLSVDDVNFKTDFCSSGAAIKFLASTNTLYILSNAPAGTNQIWVKGTNAALATNDICLISDPVNDTWQMVVISGNATDYAGTVATNANGDCLVKLFNTITNAITASYTDTDNQDDAKRPRLYKMATVFNVNPLTITSLTNSVVLNSSQNSSNTCFSQWLPLTFSGFGSSDRLKLRGKGGVPYLLTLTYSNAGGLTASSRFGN